MNNLAFLLALHSVEGLGSVRLKRLLDLYEDPKDIWDAPVKELSALKILPEVVLKNLAKTTATLDPMEYASTITTSGISVITIFDEEYPSLLKEIYDPPLVIYFKGIFPNDYDNRLGIVGTRKVTGYGKTVTEKFSYALAKEGVTIVSGLARGVDTVAHLSAIKANGKTIAVLGGGLQSIFPPENVHLAHTIGEKFGVVMSEFPPSYHHLAGNFPSRNRIISGLSKAVLVTEAAEDSGSLITARCALEQGRDVFAIPGPITSNLSSGPSNLIKDGARLVTDPGEIIQELGINGTRNKKISQEKIQKLSSLEQKILGCLANEQMHIDEICRELEVKTAEVSAGLLRLEIMGIIKSVGGGNYIKY